MRKIGLQEIDDIARGASLLGSGGGGDPYIGRLIAMRAVKECGPADLIEPDEIPDDALIVPIAMMGAPTVLIEKAIGVNEFQKLFDMVSRFFNKKIYAFMPMEAGGLNSMMPIAASARMHLPFVDADGMGRAFPELQMVTFTIGGVSASPMALVDEKGNSVIFETITNKWTEELARSVTMSCGGAVSCSLYPMDGRTLKKYGVKGIVTRSEKLGRAIRSAKESKHPQETFLQECNAIRLFQGKITDVRRENNGKFNLGHVLLDGQGEDTGSKGQVTFMNENYLFAKDGKILATTPDLITIVDRDTFTPIGTDAVRYGKRVLVVGLPCYPLWRTKEGIALAGPRVFGIDEDYIPLEQRVQEAK
ncbi:DUF917 domain-containing protein [Stecheria sp. CLA-KB-P133]|uniref:DUF917 domain-containing protein n=1 Tax=Grylomicrobium aquisgranensis TaxID=2926318 RepID=A0AB35U190_9FIRM|nr:DUF917 domain-containing protein [Stecheria sp. CLA-KB-P133]